MGRRRTFSDNITETRTPSSRFDTAFDLSSTRKVCNFRSFQYKYLAVWYWTTETIDLNVLSSLGTGFNTRFAGIQESHSTCFQIVS